MLKFPNIEEAVIRFLECNYMTCNMVDLTPFKKLKKLKIASNWYKDT